MRVSIIPLLLLGAMSLNGQETPANAIDSMAVSGAQIRQTLNLLDDLGSKGIDMLNDSLLFSEEFNRLRTDTAYFSEIYPEEYSWEQTIRFIEAEELKKAFWYLVNLYPESDKNRELVVRAVLAYDAAFRMDKVLVNTFYTYAFTDPESGNMVDNLPEITQPDVFESKLRTVKELILYIYQYREQAEN